ncbi:integral membrane protein-like protein [Melanomma pulvis-pyrius CBS 109.77]|uniref:Integral membrane protein-like protein n=1 Tax=Melanomma pulvis-pyrius CBS 109.77 TaxID=1314802 RepID=A0A6A6XTS4_9PLEO|nr:integral membrane protein-like protein [Melanomma pulvis-pyrius CBS 109.77]
MKLPPIVSTCLLALGIDCCSNIIAQRLRAWKTSVPFVFDRVLFFQFAILVALTAPVNFHWQHWLERTFPGWKFVKQKRDTTTLDEEEKAVYSRENGENKKMDDEEVKVRDWWNIFRKVMSIVYSGITKNAQSQNLDPPPRLLQNHANFVPPNWQWFTDCITLGALLNTTMFLVLMGIMKGKNSAQITTDLKNEMFPIIWNSYKVWPIANFFSTTYCPVERRIPFLSCCGLLWNIYLTLVAARL